MDFTLNTYRLLLNSLLETGYSFKRFDEFIGNPLSKVIILRHDVDKLPYNSLTFATIEYNLGIRGTYYFRAVTESWDEGIIKQIAGMGHEIGYHYEDVSLAAIRQKAEGEGWKGIVGSKKYEVRSRKEEEGVYERFLAEVAIESFKHNLERLRMIVPVKTICMHGSPLSRWDNRLLWKYFDYNDYGIIGEPYFDIDFEEVLYLTDTGRRWDGDSFNIRDKSFNHKGRKATPLLNFSATLGEKPERSEVKGADNAKNAKKKHPAPFLKFHSTFDIIKAAEEDILPPKIMMTLHPQRWTDKPLPWVKELVWQNMKNVGKYFLVKK